MATELLQTSEDLQRKSSYSGEVCRGPPVEVGEGRDDADKIHSSE